jgi:hypothetical protein
MKPCVSLLAFTAVAMACEASAIAADDRPSSKTSRPWSLQGEARLKTELLDGYNLAGAREGDTFGLLRVLASVDYQTPSFRSHFQAIATSSVGIKGRPSPVDETGLDLLQGFVEARATRGGMSMSVRAGRALMPFGSQRLIGSRYGANVPLAFEGLRAAIASPAVQIDGFYVRPVKSSRGSLNDRSSADEELWGLYGTKAAVAGTALDLYYLGYRNKAETYVSGEARELRHSVGARLSGTKGIARWDAEALYQFGSFGERSIAAWSFAIDAGVQLPLRRFETEAGLKVAVASGDSDAKDGKLGTFNPLFPRAKYFGKLSPIGPSNIVHLNPSLTTRIAPELTVSAAGMWYWRHRSADGIYDLSGHVLRRTGDTGHFIGRQFEAVLVWSPAKHLEIEASGSAFWASQKLRPDSARPFLLFGLEATKAF